MTDDTQDWTERMEELKEMYPEGSIIEVEKEDNKIFPDEPIEMVVTGHTIIESDSDSITYRYPGPRVNASTTPPDYEFESEYQIASIVRPENITDSR